ncbi:hypothetical protein [Methanosarcina sp. KYL-1]|uniref:hypothetical protein n=1 Tax=Methanosarcina sp. KYL-1 TaxID=2602068 RepID=UPI00210133C1|nr:hypothetical protein [Methanosarcina sp. KYL-1]
MSETSARKIATLKMKMSGGINVIQAKEIARKPEIVWTLDIKKDGRTYEENYMLLFPRYVSAIDEE